MFSLLLAMIYISFVSLGLPDAILGAAWPIMHQDLGVEISMAGFVSMVISLGTICSSLFSDRLTKWLGAGKVTAISVGLTALALLGFSLSGRYWMLILWAIPYGLGAGSVDAALNNYVALHYSSRHMSWLHCMWGIGASTGPYIMGLVLSRGMGWGSGYRIIGLLQIALCLVLFFTLPLWKKNTAAEKTEGKSSPALSFRQILAIPGAKEVFVAFFCYCALEQTAILWASTYMVDYLGIAEETAATLGSLFLMGITLGRAIAGFLTSRLNDGNMIRLGQALIGLGLLAMLLPLGSWADIGGILVIGLGCAPIYPSIIHSTPTHFGAERSQAIIGVQMASAYVGCLVMPPVFGLIANHVSVSLLPVYLLFALCLMVFMHERLQRKTA